MFKPELCCALLCYDLLCVCVCACSERRQLYLIIIGVIIPHQSLSDDFNLALAGGEWKPQKLQSLRLPLLLKNHKYVMLV